MFDSATLSAPLDVKKEPSVDRRDRPRIGLALGGGGARGLAHIGVLKALEGAAIPIDMIAGCSIGALVGAAYAIDPDANAIEQRFERILSPSASSDQGLKLLSKIYQSEGNKKDLLERMADIAAKGIFLNTVLIRKAYFSEESLYECICPFVCDIDVNETRIAFIPVALDLISGRNIYLTNGSLIRAVMASCAIPGFMPPISWDKWLLVDGAGVEPVPVTALKKMGAERIIGVHVGACICDPPVLGGGIDIIERVADIMAFHLGTACRLGADVFVEPDVKRIHWANFHPYRELIQAGQAAITPMLKEIQQWINGTAEGAARGQTSMVDSSTVPGS